VQSKAPAEAPLAGTHLAGVPSLEASHV